MALWAVGAEAKGTHAEGFACIVTSLGITFGWIDITEVAITSVSAKSLLFVANDFRVTVCFLQFSAISTFWHRIMPPVKATYAEGRASTFTNYE